MGQLDDDMGGRVCKAMGDMGFDVQTDQPVREIEVDADGRCPRGAHRRGQLPAPTSSSSVSAWARRWGWPPTPGCSIGVTGAVDVDRTQRSRSHPEVFAAGDCAQTFHRVTGEAVHVPSARTRTSRDGSRGR